MTSPAVEHKKKLEGGNDTVTLSTGIEARMVPVGATLIDDIVASIPDPVVPVWHNEDKGIDEENPNDPNYLRALAQTERQRAVAAMEALLVFGLDLELPEDDAWLNKIKFLQRRGVLDLSGYDLEDPDTLDLLYKKYIAVGTQDLITLGEKAGLNRQDVEQAAETFRS